MQSILTGLGVLGNQSRSGGSGQAISVPRQDNSTLAIASASKQNVKKAEKNAQAERLIAVLTDPAVLGLLTVMVGLLAAEKIPWSDNPGRNAAYRSTAAAAAVLMGLGRAGVGDLTTLLMAGGIGSASLASDLTDLTSPGGSVAAGIGQLLESGVKVQSPGFQTAWNWITGND